MKARILERLLDKSPDIAHLANLDDLGSVEELNSILRHFKQAGWVQYRCTTGQTWDDYGDDIDISAIELTAVGRKIAEAVSDQSHNGVADSLLTIQSDPNADAGRAEG